MDVNSFLATLTNKHKITPVKTFENGADELYVETNQAGFGAFCLALHQELCSPVMAMFARDLDDKFQIYCAFMNFQTQTWVFVTMKILKTEPEFKSIALQIYSANLFEREIKEMFGLHHLGNPDNRRLHLHEEVWPQGFYPLRHDFIPPNNEPSSAEYEFSLVEGEGVFEVPVGPVHAGIIAPGHFRFSVAGEPIINLEIRLGFTHRGVEKLLENKTPLECLKISECVAGDSAFAHSWAFGCALEKINRINVPDKAVNIRMILLELERMYNHVADLGGIALDVGFSPAQALSAIIKESIHVLNEKLTGSRFLKGVNVVGGVAKDLDFTAGKRIVDSLIQIRRDFKELETILMSSVSFLDRVDTTGVLRKKTAQDLGVYGLAGRAAGIKIDTRKGFMPCYDQVDFKLCSSASGDALSRLKVRMEEFSQSVNIICQLTEKLDNGKIVADDINIKPGFALGCVEGWRGPVLYWVNLNDVGKIDRVKIVDPSFRSWQGLAYAVLGEIIPDFPLCNKSFNLSYPGRDL